MSIEYLLICENINIGIQEKGNMTYTKFTALTQQIEGYQTGGITYLLMIFNRSIKLVKFQTFQ